MFELKLTEDKKVMLLNTLAGQKYDNAKIKFILNSDFFMKRIWLQYVISNESHKPFKIRSEAFKFNFSIDASLSLMLVRKNFIPGNKRIYTNSKQGMIPKTVSTTFAPNQQQFYHHNNNSNGNNSSVTRKRGAKGTDLSWNPSTNIFVNYMPSNYTKNELVSLFSPFGQILSAKVMIDLQTGHSKCFGFVRFASLSSASNAVLAMDGFVVNENKRLLCRFAGTQKENTGERTNTIYVKSLCLHFTKKDIWNIFSKFGTIIGIEMHNQNDPKSFFENVRTNNNRDSINKGNDFFNGCATITYEREEEAEEATRVMNNMKLTDDGWPLFIKYVTAPTKIANCCVAIKEGIKIEKPSKKFIENNKIERKEEKKESNNNNDINDWKIRNNSTFSDLMFSMIAEEL